MLARLIASGLSGVFVFAGTMDARLWFTAWFCLVPLLWALKNASRKHALLFGFVAGLATHLGGFYWITHLLVRFAHLPLVVALLLCLLLAAYQGLAFVGFAWCMWRFAEPSRLPAVLVVAIAMTVFDFAVPQLFPCYISLTQARVLPIIQISEWTGPVGVTFLMSLMSAAIGGAIDRRAWRPLIWSSLALVGCVAYGTIRVDQIDTRRAAAVHRRIGVVQANIGIREKGDPKEANKQHELYLRLSRDLEAQGVDLIAWSESAYPYFYWRDMTRDWPQGHPFRATAGLHKPLAFGALTYDRATHRPSNSMLVGYPDGRLDGFYDKNYLLLFGEWVPFYDELNIKRWIPESSNFERGKTVRLFEVGDMRIGPMICYEDIIPNFGRKIVRLKPNLLLNITNDAWFGATSEPSEHLSLAVFRAVEHRLDLVRSVNTGVSAHIEATGRIAKETRVVDPNSEPDAAPVTLVADVALLEPSRINVTAGDAFGWLNIAALALMLVRARSGLRRRSG